VQRTERFKQHTEKMYYPQYREKFLRMATEKSQHAERIGKKIVAFGGRLPDVAERRSTDENSWQSLSMARDQENRSADRLAEQLRRLVRLHQKNAENRKSK